MALPFNATGLWPSANFGDAPKFACGAAGNVFISHADKDVLHSLAARLAELASRPIGGFAPKACHFVTGRMLLAGLEGRTS